METTEKISHVLNDLVEINNDRVAGFVKAGENLEHDDRGLRAVFEKLAGESRSNAAVLAEKARQFYGVVTGGTSVSGSLHRAWLEVKSTFTGDDTESILAECERGEDVIKSAYRSALENADELPYEVAQMIRDQQKGIDAGHNLIKSLRDQSGESGVNTKSTGTVEDDEWKENQLGLTDLAADRGLVDVGDYQLDREINQNNYDLPGRAQAETAPDDDSSLQGFFVNELKDLLWAEQKLMNTLPKMKESASSTELRSAFENHLAETQQHVQRLEQIFTMLGLVPDTTKCDAMDGIVDEGDEIISNTENGTATRDVGLIFAGQKVEHYEIASYGGMVSLAKILGYNEVADLLWLTLKEEKAADELLTGIAENNINRRASGEKKEKGFFSS